MGKSRVDVLYPDRPEEAGEKREHYQYMYKPKHARRKRGAERVVYVLGVTPPPPSVTHHALLVCWH